MQKSTATSSSAKLAKMEPGSRGPTFMDFETGEEHVRIHCHYCLALISFIEGRPWRRSRGLESRFLCTFLGWGKGTRKPADPSLSHFISSLFMKPICQTTHDLALTTNVSSSLSFVGSCGACPLSQCLVIICYFIGLFFVLQFFSGPWPWRL